MKTLNHRAIFLQTLDGFFAPLVGAIKGAAAEIRRPTDLERQVRAMASGRSKAGNFPKPHGPNTPAKKRRSKFYTQR